MAGDTFWPRKRIYGRTKYHRKPGQLPGSYPAAFTLDKGRIGQVEYGNRVKTVSVGRLAAPKRDEQHRVQCYQRWRIRAFLNPRHGPCSLSS